jgi:hypothetical protein
MHPHHSALSCAQFLQQCLSCMLASGATSQITLLDRTALIVRRQPGLAGVCALWRLAGHQRSSVCAVQHAQGRGEGDSRRPHVSVLNALCTAARRQNRTAQAGFRADASALAGAGHSGCLHVYRIFCGRPLADLLSLHQPHLESQHNRRHRAPHLCWCRSFPICFVKHVQAGVKAAAAISGNSSGAGAHGPNARPRQQRRVAG